MQQNKISIRPQIPTALVNENMTLEEKFQNTTLRPVIKMQHDLLFLRLESELSQAALKFHSRISYTTLISVGM